MSIVATLALLFNYELIVLCISDADSSFVKTFILDLGFIMVPGSSLIGINFI